MASAGMVALTAPAETLVIRSGLGELARAAEWAETLAARLALPPLTGFAIQLCLEEALSNIVMHGVGGRHVQPPPPREIRLLLEVCGQAAFVTIEDPGPAFDPLQMAAPCRASNLEEVGIGGQGIHLMRQFAQDVAYERRDATNRLTLRFDLPPGGH